MKKSKKQQIAEKRLDLITFDYPKTPREKGLKDCPCTKKCTIKGYCRLCAAYHKGKNKLPRCER